MILLGYPELASVALLVLALAGTSWAMNLGVGRRVLIAALRTVIQLGLIGLVVKSLFELRQPWLVALVALGMLAAAGREVVARQKRRLKGPWGFGVGAGAMFVSSFTVTLFGLLVVLKPDPWWHPQYAIPVAGMLLGNTMNGVSLAMGQVTEAAFKERPVIEARLLLGQTAREAMGDIRREAMRVGLMPIINTMAAAGLVSLPGMMTGQILAGGDPLEASKYQIMIIFMIAAGTGFGVVAAVWVSAARLFDERDRLRPERLTSSGR
ncbi:MAG: iron export ABC transporter permease subunit FetB [bacterium]|nr:iron export ABC transporter permease subunit FetB [bacterium]